MKNETIKKNETGDATSARRELLGSGAATAATMMFGLLAAACGSSKKHDDTDSGSTEDGGAVADSGPSEADAAVDAGVKLDHDVAGLNALLTVEYSAITAYGAGAGLSSAKKTDPLYALAGVILKIAVDFQSHHKLHAAALVSAITELGGTPVTQDAVAKTFVAPPVLVKNPTISNALKFAANAERGAAVGYNQTLAGFEDAKLRFLASSIEGDESQHFIVLAALVLGLAAPGAKLSETTAVDVVPEPFVSTVGDVKGLDKLPAPYFA